ncbi:NAD-dependent epimerase/dehydratase family protein [Cohnella candidum]|uniref:NAD-dependent epimerase/dehydratase family protein n=1 Tax=Cohnella candidum TaxID=2674991 RepID=A0A3G3JZN1_9BACL|nr:NAD-dependent epimerase/dehydratase family protein [Cohnella candidum]AYQ72949.1 NAD-dependent epimerase/dehydratase family protein [Cohnella candidum]
MKTILVTGSMGQIGSELVPRLRRIYGEDHVIATDIRPPDKEQGPYVQLDVTDRRAFYDTAKRYGADSILHLAALLSARAERDPLLAWEINMGGLLNALETARELNAQLFTPSSIGVFGPDAPKDRTPQVTVQRPVTMYGVNKVAGELLCQYYFLKYGVDTRGLRFPGLISHTAPPGGGTTDYAVDIYFAAARHGGYESYIAAGTFMDFMYMPDAVEAVIQLMEADPSGLVHRNAYNVTAMSADPEMLAAEIRKHIPDFRLHYRVDPLKQRIAESWPDSLDTTAAENEWGFRPRFTLEKMTEEMLAFAGGRNPPEDGPRGNSP